MFSISTHLGTDDIDSLCFRVLKFPLSSGKFEYIATNLPKKVFSLKVVKTLYNLRWGEETAFRHLKYAGNMVHIHSIKPDFLIQEIYGKLTLYNFSSCITKTVTRKNASSTVYSYNFNHTQIPFSNVTFFDEDETVTLEGVADIDALKALLSEKIESRLPNGFCVIRIDGKF